jgi:biopolymer transport protein ExbB
MIAIAFIALVMFAMGVSLQLRLRRKGYAVPEKVWRHWINHPESRKGPIGKLLNFVTGGDSLKDIAMFFDELRTTELAPFERDLKIMKICVGVAPLLGLLGTVTGMLATFHALATGAGGEKTMGMVAEGISEALITTETGLVVALPGLFMQYIITRNFERYRAFLAHVETVCMQKRYKRLQQKKCASLNVKAVV